MADTPLFQTIVIDPPYRYRDKALQRGGAERHYKTMSLDELKALPIQEVAAPKCHLWLWTTSSFLQEGLALMRWWGFEYKCPLVWVKPRYGLGHYLRSATEFCLLGVKGKQPFRFHGQANWFFAPVQEHSKKPEEHFAIIERCSFPPFLEVFARVNRPGWTVVGDGVNVPLSQLWPNLNQEGKQ